MNLALPGFPGAERGSRFSQCALNPRHVRVRATKHAPSDPSRVLERRYGLVEFVERGAGGKSSHNSEVYSVRIAARRGPVGRRRRRKL